MNDSIKPSRMSCSALSECIRDFHVRVWTRENNCEDLMADVAHQDGGAVRYLCRKRHLASMMAHPSMEGRRL